MVREKIQVEDLDRVAKEHEFFVWNFVSLESYHLSIQSIFEKENPFFPNGMKQILDLIPIPYFETEVKESYDFLMYLHPSHVHTIYRNNSFSPVLTTFNRKRFVGNTFHPYCYCPEKIIELIYDLNPKFILDSKINAQY